MKTIPSAEVFIINKQTESRPPTPKEVEEWLIEFAKLHITEALKEASEKAKISKTACGDSMSCGCMGNCEYPTSFINKRSILTAYSLDNVE